MTKDDRKHVTDAAIDRVAREMLDVEPVADLRARVLRRIDAPTRSMRWLWLAAPFAAAAVVVFMVLVSRPHEIVTTPAGHDRPLPAETATRTATPTPRAPEDTARPSPPARTVRATAINEPLPPQDDQTVTPLTMPEPLSVPTIGGGRGTVVSAMQVVPISVKPLEVDPLDETPQARH